MNELKGTDSPYLQQFVDSEVEWVPFSDGLYQRAIKEAKGIHLSFGTYLHPNMLIEKSLYQEKRVAMVLNTRFINVKLDADLRPDLERFFFAPYERDLMTRVGLTNGHYPVSVLLDPETYIIATSGITPGAVSDGKPMEQGLPIPIMSAMEALETDGRQYQKPIEQRILEGEIDIQFAEVPALEIALQNAQTHRQFILDFSEGRDVTLPMLGSWAKSLIRLRHIESEMSPESAKALDLVMVTLTKWLRSSDFDHICGGVYHFQRSSHLPDARMPKTLVNQAFAIELLADALSVTQDRFFEDKVEEIVYFAIDNLKTSIFEVEHFGGFRTSLVNEENPNGTFQRYKVKRLLNEDEYILISTLFGLDKRQNWHGQWLLERQGSWRSVVDQMYFSEEECLELLESGLRKLEEEESNNAQNHIDNRVLLRPNLIWVNSLFRAADVLGDRRCEGLANNLLSYIREVFLGPERGGLQPEEGVDHPALTSLDYALLVRALLRSMEREWDNERMHVLSWLMAELMECYMLDGEWLSANDQDDLAVLYALPSADRAAEPDAMPIIRSVLQTWGTLVHDLEIIKMAEQLVSTARGVKDHLDTGFDHTWSETLNYRVGEIIVVLRGPKKEAQRWAEEIRAVGKPWWHVFPIKIHGTTGWRLPSFVPDYVKPDQRKRVTAYVARDMVVYEPVGDLDELIRELEEM